MAISGLLFGYAPSPFWVVLWGFLFTVISNTFSNAFHVYLGEIYPTAVRATAAGAAYSISRIVTAALPYILIPVLDHWGGSAVFTVVAIALGVLIIDVLALGPRTTGLALEVADRPDIAETLEPRPSRPTG
jgi:putative MFS transporter